MCPKNILFLIFLNNIYHISMWWILQDVNKNACVKRKLKYACLLVCRGYDISLHKWMQIPICTKDNAPNYKNLFFFFSDSYNVAMHLYDIHVLTRENQIFCFLQQQTIMHNESHLMPHIHTSNKVFKWQKYWENLTISFLKRIPITWKLTLRYGGSIEMWKTVCPQLVM